MTEKKTAAAEPLILDLVDVDEKTTTHNAPALQGSQEVAVAAPAVGPMSDAIAFLRAGGTAAELRDMLALQREWKADQAKQAFTEAMAEFKKDPPTLQKDKRVYFEGKNGGTTTDYWHATLGNITDAIVEGLAKVGISHSWKPERKGDRIHVTCTLTHKMGHSESIELDGPLDNSGNKNSIQQAAATTTYLSRYTLLMITGLAVKDEVMPDTDGRGAHAPDPMEKIDPELLQRARDASMLGWKALATFSKSITEAERNMLIPASASLKDAALAVDAAAKEPKK